jgi:hypothetical protein
MKLERYAVYSLTYHADGPENFRCIPQLRGWVSGRTEQGRLVVV